MSDTVGSLGDKLDFGDEPQDPLTLRNRLVPELRRFLGEGRAAAERDLLANEDGLACARRLAAHMDEAL